MKDLLLITPPFTQLNTPYPATAYIKGFLNTKDISSYQSDLGIEVILSLFNKNTFRQLFAMAYEADAIVTENTQRIYALRHEYLKTLDAVILFLQGKNDTLARQLCTDSFLPKASRFQQLDDLEWAFGNMGMQDKAKHLATLYLEDLSDFIVECIDPNFGFSRYAERLGRSANSFDELYDHLNKKPTFIDKLTLNILKKQLEEHTPKLVCFSVPFPGNLYSAFRCAQFIKTNYPDVKIAMGGGFPNTELRSLTDVRVFEFFDFITLDDGELPLELVHQYIVHGEGELKRAFVLEDGKVVYKNNSLRQDYKQQDVGTPDYADLQLENYISVIEIANPMHSLWSDGRWNKLTMAHGCYWGKCTFCDISLDYIKIYEPVAASMLVDRVETLIAQTGESGFHFVDEAAPPSLMKAFALEVLKRNLTITWWTNIRFEKNFTQDLCYLLKASGCIAVSGGLEVASDRLLKLIDKGVTVAQVAQVTRNFTEANIMVHS
ncbi:MAG: radical SAM protein, partial [Maribacter dokdonensis]